MSSRTTTIGVGGHSGERSKLSNCPGLNKLPPALREAFINGHGNEPQVRDAITKAVSESYRTKVQHASTPSSPTSPKK
jgi:hypothetical protein